MADNTFTHTFVAGRFEITVETSVVKVREVWTAEPPAPQVVGAAVPFDDPAISEIVGAGYTASDTPISGADWGIDVNAYRRGVAAAGVTDEDITRAALRVTEVGGGRGSKSARWAAMCDLLELWVRRYGDPPKWGEVANPGPGHDPIPIGQWFGNERGRLRNGKMTVAQRERMNQLLGEDWAKMRRSPYGVNKG